MPLPFPSRSSKFAAWLLGFVLITALLIAFREHEITYRVIYLDGLTYTVTEASYANSIGVAEAKEDKSYVVVRLRIENSTPKWVEHTVRFRLVDSKGPNYDMAGFETVLTNNDFYRHFDLLKEPLPLAMPLRFDLLKKSSKSISLVFEVPKESLSRKWSLLVRDRYDKFSIGVAQVGSISASAE